MNFAKIDDVEMARWCFEWAATKLPKGSNEQKVIFALCERLEYPERADDPRTLVYSEGPR